MFDNPRGCKLLMKMIRKVKNILCFFNLRQGTILIAVHQIALSSFILTILLVGISHVSEMLTFLQNDMEDDAERRGFYEVTYGNQLTFHEGDVISTNNQRRFANAKHLVSESVIALYTSTILTSIYLMCSIALLNGALKYKKGYINTWLVASIITLFILVTLAVVGENYSCITRIFFGLEVYRVCCSAALLLLLYAIGVVTSFSMDMTELQCEHHFAEERGERLLLLDHAAHSSLLSAAQINKLSHGTRTHFV